MKFTPLANFQICWQGKYTMSVDICIYLWYNVSYVNFPQNVCVALGMVRYQIKIIHLIICSILSNLLLIRTLFEKHICLPIHPLTNLSSKSKQTNQLSSYFKIRDKP